MAPFHKRQQTELGKQNRSRFISMFFQVLFDTATSSNLNLCLLEARCTIIVWC